MTPAHSASAVPGWPVQSCAQSLASADCSGMIKLGRKLLCNVILLTCSCCKRGLPSRLYCSKMLRWPRCYNKVLFCLGYIVTWDFGECWSNDCDRTQTLMHVALNLSIATPAGNLLIPPFSLRCCLLSRHSWDLKNPLLTPKTCLPERKKEIPYSLSLQRIVNMWRS